MALDSINIPTCINTLLASYRPLIRTESVSKENLSDNVDQALTNLVSNTEALLDH